MRRIASFIVCSVAVLLTSCNINVDMQDNNKQKSDPTAIGFGVYMNRGVTTKAGYAGELTTDELKGVAGGFGVFSYYGNGAMYNETMKPDFMYNQKVTFTSNNVWEYSPIKYWPNEFGEAAGNEVADRLSFFAYAPYVAVTPSTGIVTGDDEYGILGMSRNISAGDPQVMYGARLQPGGGVDLCWGVAANDFTSSVDGNNNRVDKGKPYINLIKPKTCDKIAFEFNHALAQLNVQIDADIDVESHAASSLDSKTRVYVRSVTFTGFTTRGSLNLNSVAGNPDWSDISGAGRLRRDPVTVYDGRSDGHEGVISAVDVNETPAVLSPIIVQSKIFGQETTTESIGVTNETVNLFANCDTTSDHSKPVADKNAPVMVIPIAGVPLTVTIVYDIETADPSLAGYLSDGVTRGISIENKITKSIQLDNGTDMTLESGKKYVIGLHLGLTSVKFDAQVASWDNGQHEGSAFLPVNTASIASITLTPASTTAWLGDGQIDLPRVEVKNADNTDITASSTIEWSTAENPDVASYDATTGKIQINGVGVAKIRATVTYGDQSATADYVVNVNAVTGVSISPADGDFTIGSQQVFTATLTLNNPVNGSIAAEDMPIVTWTNSQGAKLSATSSLSTADGVNAVATTTASTTSSASAGSTVGVRAKVAGKYTGTGEISALALLTFIPATPTPTLGYFRGYDVSKGILMRTEVSDQVTYSLTDPTDGNQFEVLDYYGQDESKNKYYLQWSKLYEDLGGDADGNIKADSDKLPAGWTLPGGGGWNQIIFGAATGIKINGQAVTYGYALVTVKKGTDDIPSLLLVPDGAEITLTSLEGKEAQFNEEDGDYGFDNIELSLDDYTYLMGKNCRILPISGRFDGTINNDWEDGLQEYYPTGYYWSYDCKDNEGEEPHFLSISKDYGWVSISQSTTKIDYYPVRLVKKIN